MRLVRVLRSYFTKPISHSKFRLHIFGVFGVALGIIVGAIVSLTEITKLVRAANPETWDFSVSGNYTLSDSTLIEISGSSARLKLLEYDGATANTVALYHFDDDAVDATSNDNDGTATTLSYTTGNFDNAAVFSGAGSQVSIPDSSSLSLSASHTLEAWVNLDTTFSATSHSERQMIYDKGAYQMYLEHTSGKLVYELEPSGTKSWTQQAGPNLDANNGQSINSTWDLNGKTNEYSSVKMGSYWFVAIGTAAGPNDAEVWRCSGCDGSTPTWVKIGGDGNYSSWPMDTYEYAASLGTDGTTLYVGMGGATAGDGDLWRCSSCTTESPTWTKVGGDAVNSGWGASTFESVTALVVSGTTVYAGIGNNTAGDAEVWRCTSCDSSPTWGGTRLGGDGTNSSWNTSYEEVRSLALFSTYLVAGIGNTAGDGEVWSTDTTSISWVKRGGDGTASGGQSWGSTYEQVNGLAGSGNILYVGLGTTPANEAEVWRCDLSSSCTATAGWTQIGGDGLNTSWNTNYEAVRTLTVTGTTLYVGLGDGTGDAELWRCTSCTGTPSWSQLAGDGTGISGQSWGATHTQVNSVLLDGNYAYVGVSSTSWSSEYWRCDVTGSCTSSAGWTRLGGSYANNSWESVGLGVVQELAGGDGKMYAGMGNAQAGNALVWEYNTSSDAWSVIGGQSLNSSWGGNTYESVDSLLYYKGMLYAGLGRSTNEAEVWRWNGTTWTQVGGDGLNSSWNTNYENVGSLVVYRDKLYAGLGNNANGDAEVYRCASCDTGTPTWVKVGGDGINSGWAAGTFREVPAMVQTHDMLYVGLAGATAGDAEIWRCSSSCDGGSPAWTRVGGDATNSSWANSVYERVDSMAVYEGKIIVGLGSTAGDAEVWACTSCEGGSPSWGSSKIGGDDVDGNSPSTYGWADSTFEQVLDMVVYNGFLYAGIGITAGESEVWRYDTSAWTKVGGDGLNSSWDSTINYVNALSVIDGKMYAGTGGDANNDATIWSYGNDSVAKSAVLSLTSGTWYHLAATYDSTNSEMQLFVNGTQSGSTATATLTIADNTKSLLIGRGYGSRGNVSAGGSFIGKLDELRISNVERSSFTTTKYSSAIQTVRPTSAVFTSQVQSYSSFASTDSADSGSITYRLSSDGGTTWQYYSSGWTTSASTSQTSSASVINTNISTFPVTTSGILWQAVVSGNGSQRPTITQVSIGAVEDTTAPTNPDTLTALSASGGSSISTNTWYTHTGPYFSWTGASDAGAGISGYYVYFGTDNTAEPTTAGAFQAGNTYTASSLVSGSTYYLRIKSRDSAQNSASSTWSAFTYKFDNSAPSAPTSVTVNPSGYASTNAFTFTWSAVSDVSGSTLAGYQYKTDAGSGGLSDWSSTTALTTASPTEPAHTTGENIFYVRAIDTAGNVSGTPTQVSFYYGGDGPSAPQLLSVNPSTSTTNSFAFSWTAPSTYSGTTAALTYCYTVNTLPSANTCTFTSAGATSLSASSFATQVGLNTFYLVAKNGSDYGSSINYGSYTSVTFTANTSAPGIPLNTDIADVSVKSTESWKLAISWEAPSDEGSGVDEYEIYRSTDDSTFTKIASTTGIAYVDTGLDETTYYYKVRACDDVGNCGSYSSSVDELPSGKYTTASSLSSGPTVSNVTTKQAKISWGTDRTSDSKVQYGTTSGTYFSSEPSNSTQVTDHAITLTNLSPGTTYYYKAKWTDEDGNTGSSSEKSFSTDPAPTVKDVKVKTVSLTSAVLEFTTSGSSKVKIYYGETTAFGTVQEISTSATETTYTAQLEELEDGTKYYYQINTFDSESAEYEGTILDFETLPRPKIATVRIQQVRNTAQPTALITWTTNTQTSSIVTYYPEGSPDLARDEVNVNLQDKEHQIIIRGLQAQTPYVLIVKGRDKAGNEAQSDPQRFTTATDTRPAQISELKVEGSVQTTSENSQEAVAQLIVSWTTDEPSTSQVEYGEGTGTTYSQKSQEDSNLTTNHLVVISGLTPSKVYHLRAISKDKASNISESIDTVTITPKATDNALNLVISNLQQVFGFLGALQ